MINTQTTLKAALLLTILAMLTACTPQTASEDSTDYASRIPTTTTTQNASKPVLFCNQKTQNGLTAKVMAYVDSANKVRNDYMKVKFTQMPAGFENGDYIQFFRWQASTTGQTYLDPVPTQARFETLNGQVITNFSPVIYCCQVSAIEAQSGMSDVNTFFQNVRLVVDVRDPQANFDVLKIAMYNSASTNTINMDMLMPSFYASPTDYAFEGGAARANNLQALHPFASMISQNKPAAEFQCMGTSFCF